MGCVHWRGGRVGATLGLGHKGKATLYLGAGLTPSFALLGSYRHTSEPLLQGYAPGAHV